VFQPGLGTIKGITAKLEIKFDAQSKCFKAREVLYSLQEAVEGEYNHLESKGIVERVEFSDWATPMVHVPKADGTTRHVAIMPSLSTHNSMFHGIQFLFLRMSSSNCVEVSYSLN